MDDELDIAAAEYVLGTLPADERARFASRLPFDPDLRAAVARWQMHLSALDEAARPEVPPESVWRAIERATSAAIAPTANPEASNVVQLRRRLALWRGAALVGGALAAGFAGLFVVDRLAVPDTTGGRYVAVVDTGGREPAMIAEVDTRTGRIQVRSLAAEIPAGRSLELWHVAEGNPPRSLGILQAGAEAQTIQDVPAGGPVSGLIAATVEPPGGSPTGAPTGPIVYSGALVPMD